MFAMSRPLPLIGVDEISITYETNEISHTSIIRKKKINIRRVAD